MFSFMSTNKKKSAKRNDYVVVDAAEPGQVTMDWPMPVRPTASYDNKSAYPIKVNGSVFELYAPDGKQQLDIVFFHGLQIGAYRNAYLETWQSGLACWPQDWLPQDFPRARILSISYDSSALRSEVEGRVDLPKLGEILVEDVIVSAAVGNKCPVMLVGHSLGGIVIKQLCLEAERNLNSDHVERKKPVKSFLKHISGIFYYSVPHGGSQLANLAKNYMPSPGPMLDYLTVLSVHTEEINNAFRKLRQARRWPAAAVSENVITKFGPLRVIVVTEASASRDVDTFTLLQEDHIFICKPRNTDAPSYVLLKDFIDELVPRGWW